MSNGVHAKSSRCPSGTLKRPRDSDDTLREGMKSFGLRAAALKSELHKPIAGSASDVARTVQHIWDLMGELRPYVTAAVRSGETPHCDARGSGPRQAVRFAWPSLRIFISVAQFSAAAAPGVLLHGALVLLSLLPAIAARDEECENPFFERLHQLLVALSKHHPPSFAALLRALLRPDAVGAFAFSPVPPPRGARCGRCSIDLSRDAPKSHSGTGQCTGGDPQRLFVVQVVAERPYEVICAAHGFCHVMTALFAANVALQPTLEERDVLVRVACGLIAARVGGAGSAVTEALHTSAGALLREMMARDLLVSWRHGPALLYTLLQHIRDIAEQEEEALAVRTFAWELPLLQWLVAEFTHNNNNNNNYIMEWAQSGGAVAAEADALAAALEALLAAASRAPLSAAVATLLHLLRAAAKIFQSRDAVNAMNTIDVPCDAIHYSAPPVLCGIAWPGLIALLTSGKATGRRAALETLRAHIGYTAQQALLSDSFVTAEALVRAACLCCDADAPEEIAAFVVAYAIADERRVLRCGPAADALRRLLAGRKDVVKDIFTFGPIHYGSLNGIGPNPNNSHKGRGGGPLVRRLEALQSAFAPPKRDGEDVSDAVCDAILDACIALWADGLNESHAVRAAALDAARAVMTYAFQSMEDLCRRRTDIVCSPFFAAAFDHERADMHRVVLFNLDALLPPCVYNSNGHADQGGAKRLERIGALLGDQLSPKEKFAALMAHALLATPVTERLLYVEQLLQCFGVTFKELPGLVNDAFAPLIVSLISLEGDRQLRPDWSYDNSSEDSNGMSFDAAVGAALYIGDCAPDASGVAHALHSPAAAEDHALSRYVFNVLDSVVMRMGFEDGVLTVSECTAHRWLCGLTTLIRFLGLDATLIAPKLTAMLMRCSTRPRLVQSICTVWRDLLANCTEEYRREHAPAIVVDLLILESRADATALCLLEEAMRVVHESSAQEAFWESYWHVMGSASALIQCLRPVGAAAQESSSAAVVVEGFLAVMHSSSTTCKEFFVRALFQYLSKTDSAGRMEMTRAASESPQLIPTLMNCACELRGDVVQCALACIGIIGAMAPVAPGAVLFTARNKTGAQRSDEMPTLENCNGVNGNHTFTNHHKGHGVATASFGKSDVQKNRTAAAAAAAVRSEQFLPEDLNWRTLARKLLGIHCLRALADTTDLKTHDRAAYAVQELLRVCTEEERGLSNSCSLHNEVLHVEELQRYTWWSHLSSACKQMLEGYTTTSYIVYIQKTAELRSPIFVPGTPFHTWMNAWFCDLLLRCNGIFGNMARSLRNIAKGNRVLITFLLPHIILNLLDDGPNANEEAVVAEMNLLLRAASRSAAARAGERVLSVHSQGLLATDIGPESGVDEHVQLIFHVLEDMEHLYCVFLRALRRVQPIPVDHVDEKTILRVVNRCGAFFARVNWATRAEAAVAIGSNVRALRCVEQRRYMPSAGEVLTHGIPLQRIFAAIDDRDSARSLHRLQEHHPEDAAFSHENSGEWVLALRTCEPVLQQRPNSAAHQFTALRCMQQLGQLHLMARYSQALLARPRRPEAAQMAALQSYANEAAWRLGEWESVDARGDHQLPVGLALPLAALMDFLSDRGSRAAVFTACAAQRQKIAPALRATCREEFTRGYAHAVLLHALTDVETAVECVVDMGGETGSNPHACVMLSERTDPRKLQDLPKVLRERARLADATLETQELLLSLHRALFRAFGMRDEVAETWMRHAKLLRKEGLLEAALSVAKQTRLGVGDGAPNPAYYTTVAKLLHEMGMPKQAIEFAEDNAADENVALDVRAKLRVLVTRWMQDIRYQTSQEVIAAYESALSMHASEKSHHYLALFYDTLFASSESAARDSDALSGKISDEARRRSTVEHIEAFLLRAIDHFGRALQLGVRTATVSLPRMLTLWLDNAAVLTALANESYSSSGLAGPLLRRMNGALERYLLADGTRLSDTLLVTALTQLLSRLNHANTYVLSIITRTVVRLMAVFPQQCLWQVMPIALSKQSARSEIVRHDIITQFMKQVPSQKRLVENFTQLFKALIDLCNCPATALTGGRSSPDATLAGQPFIQRIEQMLPSAGIILPTMMNLTPDTMWIPNDTDTGSGNNTRGNKNNNKGSSSNNKNNKNGDGKNNTVPGAVYACNAKFYRFEDRVNIMSSLQKPKRITVITDDGERVPFLCKSRDEPRKDMRMMEIASLMNTFFWTDTEARRKRFFLRRYAVAALNDDCAVIEWMNHTAPFRRVVEDCYAVDGTGVRLSQVKAWKAKVDSGTLSKLDMLVKNILPHAKPVLHGWFHGNFIGHQEWYHARTVFTQATALWSIAGHIVGLGDRHGENLMMDLRSGELMHVDFACMFDKGETLEVPERVRFRLTQNLVDGMGVLGVDGPFRSCCQTALRCQMKNKMAVMNVVETLLHDPLVEWTRQSSGRTAMDPKRLIDRVSRRLDGYLDLYTQTHEKDTLALGCEGQVSKLISHSSANENLSEMYVWWMAWL